MTDKENEHIAAMRLHVSVLKCVMLVIGAVWIVALLAEGSCK